ncbi:MAG: ribosome-associated translation inhibitor RaiA [Terriglobia bacterium]|jgi:putative sigma-54 modulation protein|nr:ribosome-associated translation inhibitor RaiA [Terriglobia bacterium]
MNVEYTGRQFEITPAIRKEVEAGLNKISKFLGETFKSKVILTAEKSRRIAEITIKRRSHPIVGLAESQDMSAAISEALEHIEKQALKHNGRKRDTKRVTKSKWKREAPEVELTMAVGASTTTAVPVVVHKFPGNKKTTEAHLVRSEDAVAIRPMTLEEAVKECEFRDREVFVFRDKEGNVKVLHRKKDGKLELIEA